MNFTIEESSSNETTTQPFLPHNTSLVPTTILPPNRYISMKGHTLIGTFLLAVTVLGVIENALVINLLRKEKRLHTLTNNYVMALSTSDLFMSIAGVSFASVSSFYGRWIFGIEGCIFHGFIVMFLGLNDLYLMTATAVDRYIAIVKPEVRAKMTTRSSKFIIFMCGFTAFMWSLFPLLGWNSFTYEGLHTSCSINWKSRLPADVIYIILLFVCFFCVPVMIISGAYSRIYIEVRRGLNSIGDNIGGKRKLILEKQIAVTLFMVFVGFLFSWLPYACVCLLIIAGDPTNISPLAAAIPSYIAKASVVWNPALYVGSNKLFRMYFYECYVRRPVHNVQHQMSNVISADANASHLDRNAGNEIR